MELKLVSQPSGKTATLGTLYKVDLTSITGDFAVNIICRTLEDVVRKVPGQPVSAWKVPGQTAIPSGRYRVEVTYSPKFKRWLPVLHDVPGFTGIRIHAGNTAKDTEGCILVGVNATVDNEGVCDSKVALNDSLLPLLGECSLRGEEVYLTVVRT